jgi:hypothetical protein
MRPLWTPTDMDCMRRPASLALALIALATAVLAVTPVAGASTLVDRHATDVRLSANKDGVALLTYRTLGKKRNVLAYGAINMSRLRLKLDYSGGWGSKVADWRTFKNACGPYTGPALQYLTAACTMRDGTHWAAQEWIRIKPNFGGKRGDRELRISHWSGPIAELAIHADWSKHRSSAPGGYYHHMFGRYTYRGKGVFGKRTTRLGAPLDDLGRNIYIDALDSDYGPGWLRVNGFVARQPMGQFCFEFGEKLGFGPRAEAFTGRSSANQYRAGVMGPGVTPDIFVSFAGPGDVFDPVFEQRMNQLQRDLIGSSSYGCGDPGGRDG